MEGSNILEEKNIADNISKYLKRRDFITRNISSIDRILQLYFNSKHRNKAVDKEVIAFLFKYLKEKGKEGSVLFRHIKDCPDRNYIITRLFREFRYNFEFSFIAPLILLSTFDLIQINEKLKRFLYFSIILIPLLFFTTISLYAQTYQILEQYEKESVNNEILSDELKSTKLKYMNEVKSKEKLNTEIQLKENKLELCNANLLNERSKNELCNANLLNERSKNELCNANLLNERSKNELCNADLLNERSKNEQLKIDLSKCNEEIEKNEQITRNNIENMRKAFEQIENLKNALNQAQAKIKSLKRHKRHKRLIII